MPSLAGRTGSAPQLDRFQKTGQSRRRHDDARRDSPRCDHDARRPRPTPRSPPCGLPGCASPPRAGPCSPGSPSTRTPRPTRSAPGCGPSSGTISTQAVYDVLAACVDAGLVRRIEPAGHPARFERRVADNHHHLVCRRCGAAADVDCVDRPRPVPGAVGHPRLRRRRGGGRVLGAVPRLPGAFPPCPPRGGPRVTTSPVRAEQGEIPRRPSRPDPARESAQATA